MATSPQTTVNVPAPPRRRGDRLSRLAGNKYILLLPAVLALLAVAGYPLFYGIRASFTKYRYGRDVGSAGFSNYDTILHDATFWTAMLTTAKYVVVAVTIETILGLLLALLLTRELRFGGLLRVGLIIPMTIAPVVVGVMWRLMYASDVGVVNPLFEALGLPAPNVLTHETSAFIGVVIVDVWEWTPLMFLIILAGLQSLPQEPLEAARVDGAGPLRTFFDQTLPLLRPVLVVAIVLRVIDAIGTFDQIFVLTRGGPGTSTQLISIYAYNTAFQFTQYGEAMAMVIALLLVMVLLFIFAIRRLRRSALQVSG